MPHGPRGGRLAIADLPAAKSTARGMPLLLVVLLVVVVVLVVLVAFLWGR